MVYCMSFVPEQILQQSAFGELMASARDPEIQISAQYDTSVLVRELAVSGGSTEITGGEFTASSGTDPDGFAAIFSDNLIIAKPGQGAEIIVGARFEAGIAGNRQSAGAASASDGIVFGFEGTEFGVFFTHDGRVQVEELTITTPAGGNEATTITINGDAFTVDITAGTSAHNAAEIADSLNLQVALYNFTQNQNQVVCRSIFAAPETGSFLFSSPGSAVAAWSQVSDGVVATDEFFAQDAWNRNTLLSGDFILDPTKVNTYKIIHNGDISYYILNGDSEEFVLVHRVIHTNTEQSSLFSVASFRLVWSSTNSGATTDKVVRGTFAAAFNQGRKVQTTGTESAFNTVTAVGTDPTNILTIRCREVFGTKVNLGRILPSGITSATDSTKGAIIQVIKNATFADELNFSYQDKEGSIAEIDTTETLVTGGEVLSSFAIFTSISLGTALFRNVLLPGDTITLAMNVTAAPNADMSASAIWEEDL